MDVSMQLLFSLVAVALLASPANTPPIVLAQYYEEEEPEPDPYVIEDPEDPYADPYAEDEQQEPEETGDPTFAGYDCLDDCSGHSAGFVWAQENGLTSEDECSGYSMSFIEGCRAYFEDPYRDPYEDDAGNPVP